MTVYQVIYYMKDGAVLQWKLFSTRSKAKRFCDLVSKNQTGLSLLGINSVTFTKRDVE